MSRMKVVLRDEVQNLGGAGEIVLVAGGYARNYLIPRGLAVPATKGNLAQAETWQRGQQARVEREVEAAQEIKTRLEAQPLRVEAQAGPDGRLFGSVTAPMIVDAAKRQLDTEVDRHAITLDEPIRHLGFHTVDAKLHPEVIAQIVVEVAETGA